MSRPWRLRHKLVFGLALVVGSVALLLGGALYGLSSYFESSDSNQWKISEMRTVVVLRDSILAINTLAPERGSNETRSVPELDRLHVTSKIEEAKQQYRGYCVTHENIQKSRLDPDNGEYEQGQIGQMELGFAELDAAVREASLATAAMDLNQKTILRTPRVAAAHQKLLQLANDLYAHLYDDVRDSFERSKSNHRRSLYISGTATAIALLLILTLLYYFRVWVFQPIKELQAGVHRVHGGNFDQPIRLTSKDELEELADEFNAMTVRLRDIYKNLAQQVNERTRQLVRSERMVSVGFLAAGVAHEINNPLASISFCSESLERRLQEVLAKFPGDSETITKYLRMIQQESFRCKTITQKLLDFSRSGGRREPVELGALIADVFEVAQHLPNARGKTFHFRPEGQVTALASGPDIKSVVLNLVVNALDSLDDNGSVTATLAVRGETAEMTFTDTGCGMNTDVLDNIFEPFFTRNRTGNGTGLGLSISHQIVDQHGGTIHATSPGPGKGSTFIVRIPLRSPETKPEPREARTAPQRSKLVAA